MADDPSLLALVLPDRLAPRILAWWKARGPSGTGPAIGWLSEEQLDEICRLTTCNEGAAQATIERLDLAGLIVDGGISDTASMWLLSSVAEQCPAIVREAGYELPEAERKPGAPRVEPRDGDKRQARRRVQTLIENGTLPKPADVLCVDCKYVPAREYDHYLGYDAPHHEDVEALCAKCHHAREAIRAKADYVVASLDLDVVAGNNVRMVELADPDDN